MFSQATLPFQFKMSNKVIVNQLCRTQILSAGLGTFLRTFRQNAHDRVYSSHVSEAYTALNYEDVMCREGSDTSRLI